MITKEELDKMVAEYVEARKRYYKIKDEIRPMIDSVTKILNNIGYNIGDLEYSVEEFDMGGTSVSTKCGRTYYGEYDTEYRSFPVEYLRYYDEWKKIAELEDERIKKQKEKEKEERRIRLEKEKKAKQKRALLNKAKKEAKERAEYERLKAKFGKEAHV